MNFQKLKVLDSCSTSESDERYYEPNIVVKKPDPKFYKKQKHADETNNMLTGYVEQRDISEVDARLLVGVVSKVPMPDLPSADNAVEKAPDKTKMLNNELNDLKVRTKIQQISSSIDEYESSDAPQVKNQFSKRSNGSRGSKVSNFDNIMKVKKYDKPYIAIENEMSRTVDFNEEHPRKTHLATDSDIEHHNVISQLEDPGFLNKLDNQTIDDLCQVLSNAKQKNTNDNRFIDNRTLHHSTLRLNYDIDPELYSNSRHSRSRSPPKAKHFGSFD